jgi:hypothetical protein
MANCQCSKYKVDIDGLCGGPPGCWNEQGGQETCEKHGDKWLGNPPVVCGDEIVQIKTEPEFEYISKGSGSCAMETSTAFQELPTIHRDI